MKSFKITKSKVLDILMILILLILTGTRESRGCITAGESGFIYKQTEEDGKSEKYIISNLELNEFHSGVLSGIYGNFLLEDSTVSFHAIKFSLHNEKVILMNENERFYKGKAKYKDSDYGLDVKVNWPGFGANMSGTLYSKLTKNHP